MKLKPSTLWGRPVLVTFDGGIWYWDRFFLRVQFIPHGHRSQQWNSAPIIVYTDKRTDNYKGAVKLALRCELKRLNGEYEYEVNEAARMDFFATLGVDVVPELSRGD